MMEPKVGIEPKIENSDYREAGALCPVTNLPVFARPDWTDVPFGNDVTLTLNIIGGNILLIRPCGYARRAEIEKVMAFITKVVQGTFGEEGVYAHISDYTNLLGATPSARRYMIDCVRKNDRALRRIFFGTGPLLGMSIKLLKKIIRSRRDIHIVRDYDEAIHLAIEGLEDLNTPSPDGGQGTKRTTSVYCSKEGALHEILEDPDWELREDGFSVRFQIIDGNILHSISDGFFKEAHVASLFELRDHKRRKQRGGEDHRQKQAGRHWAKHPADRPSARAAAEEGRPCFEQKCPWPANRTG